MAKLYIECGGEIAYPLSWWVDEAEDKKSPIKIELQKTEKNSECMWCATHGEFVDRGDHECGRKQCPTYEPCNGKSGRCRALKNTLVGTEKFFTVYPDGDVRKGWPSSKRMFEQYADEVWKKIKKQEKKK